jgi:hypothetical protein
MRNAARIRLWSNLLREIAKDAASLLLNRYIFRQMQEVVRRNRNVHGIFNRWMQVNYMTSASSGIRRHVLPKKRMATCHWFGLSMRCFRLLKNTRAKTS